MPFILPDLPAVRLPDEHWTDRTLTRLGTAIDATALRALRFIIDRALVPSPGELPSLRALAEPYVTEELQQEPRAFFSFMDAPPPSPTMSGRTLRTLPGGVVIAREFSAPYRYFCPRAADDARAFPESQRVPVEHWVHTTRRPAATIVALHGFTMGQPRFDAFVMMAHEWFRRGLDIALVTLPFHGVRAPRQARFSGELFASRDIGRLNESVRQAVYEIRMVSDWTRRQSGAPVGLLGLSLGAYLTALMAGLTDELDFAVPMLPPVCLGDLAWRLFEHSRYYRHPTPLLTREELRTAYRVHSPLTYPLRIARERVLIIGARGDRIVPPEHPHALWQHWGRPSLFWFSGSHLAPFRRQRIVAAVADKLTDLGILGARAS